MATAKKLPSGSWRCQVYDYTDENGKRHYKSFTSTDQSAKGKRADLSDQSEALNHVINDHFTNLCNTKYHTK